MEKNDFETVGGVTGARPFGELDDALEGARLLSSPRGDVYYWVRDSAGEGAPWLMLLHGAGMDHRVFSGLTGTLGRQYNIIIPDLPLHGASEEYGDFTLTGCAYDIRDILNDAGADRAFIAGHCIGGCVGQEFANLFPEYCAGLVLIDTFPLGVEHYGGNRWIEKTAGLLRVMPAGAFAAALSGAFTATVPGNKALMRIMAEQNTACVVDALIDTLLELPGTQDTAASIPTAAIIGGFDRVGRIRKLNAEAAERRGYPLRVLPRAGHTPYLDDPEGFISAMEGLLNEML